MEDDAAMPVRAVPMLWIRYLQVVSAATLAFGLVMVFAPGLTEWLFGQLLYERGSFPASFSDDATDYVAQTHSVIGAVVAGWSLLVLWVVTLMLSRAVPGAWSGLVLSLTVWFVLDSVASFVRGFPANVVLNVVLYAAFLPGLIGTRPVAAR